MHTDEFIATERNTRGRISAVVPRDRFYFHYNPDLSGEVLIESTRYSSAEAHTVQSIVIPGEMLLEFIGRRMASETISQIENLTGIEFLKVVSKISER